METYKVLVVGCGNMGTSHARAYHKLEQFEIVGLVSRNPESRNRLSDQLGGLPAYSDFEEALKLSKPNVVSINTYPETHADYVRKSLNAKAHVFVEKPIATTVEDSMELVKLAKSNNLKLVVGYILRVHPAWAKFVSLAQNLGKPLVMRMNLNQQSCGMQWETHKNLMKSMSPIVDCGVHYVDIMCLMTQAKPIKVSGIGAKLSNEIDAQMYNYGQLQVTFDDGSVGWYEAGWGPMISETAFFVKDVMGPKGSVSIAEKTDTASQNIDEHTQTGALHLHFSDVDKNGNFVRADESIPIENEPTHDELCQLEQEYLLKAIEEDLDLSKHLEDAINSLRIVLAADESFRTGKTVYLD
nr:Gfo/Idh/MocA family oxidoreductase [uncultured Allomuricauda sp.]